MITHNKPTLGKEEEQAVIQVLRSGWVAQGREVRNFENEVCSFLGLPEGHAVAVSSGTAALYLALIVLKARDKQVAFPAYACSALKNACSMSGGVPTLLDNEVDSPNVDLLALDQSKVDIAIIPHMFGIPISVPVNNAIDIIEDCAQALGASVDGIPVGVRGRVGIYSFYATKMITSGGQGGMVVSKERALIDEIRDYREFDYRSDKKQRFNFQMTDIQAAIGRVQLQKLPGFIARRQEIFDCFRQTGFAMMDVATSGDFLLKAVRYRAVLRTDQPQEVIDMLEYSNIKGIVPMNEWELLGDLHLFPNAYKLSKSTVSLPIYPSLSARDVDLIVSVLRCTRKK